MEKVLVVNTCDMRLGGITQNILNYIGALHDIVSFSIVAEGSYDERVIKAVEGMGLPVYYLPDRRKSPAAYMSALYRTIKQGNFDIVHAHGNSATMSMEMAIAALCGVRKRIVHCHNSQCGHPYLNHILRPCFNKLYTEAVACSKSAGNWLFGVDSFTVLHNAVDLDRYRFSYGKRKAYREKIQVSDDTLVIGHVGGFNEQKNQEFLLEIFCELRKRKAAVLLLIGTGTLENRIKEKAEQMGAGDSVRFPGASDDVAGWLCAMDVFLFPSKWEGLGMAAIEAQACGLPVLASTEVPEEVNITRKVEYLELGDPVSLWVDETLFLGMEANQDSKVNDGLGETGREINKSDFDSYDIAREKQKLLQIYQLPGTEETR